MKYELRNDPKSPPRGTQKVRKPSACDFYMLMLKIFMTVSNSMTFR